MINDLARSTRSDNTYHSVQSYLPTHPYIALSTPSPSVYGVVKNNEALHEIENRNSTDSLRQQRSFSPLRH